MSSPSYCRAFALVCISLLIPSFTFAEELPERTMITATNKITSEKDSLAICKINEDGSVISCHEFTTDIPLNNPIQLASDETSLFILNYGVAGASMGTSFALKCNLPKFDDSIVSCKSILAFANRSHLTGMKLVGEKIFFTQSYTYGENSNFNYLLACDIVENTRVVKCGIPVFLKSKIMNPQSGTNITMDITIIENTIFVVDHVGQTTFECTMPNDTNAMICAPQEINKTQKNIKTPSTIEIFK